MERIIITEVDNTFNVEALSSYDVVYVPGFSNNHASPAFTDGATLFRTPTLVTSKYEFFKYFGNNGLNDYPRFDTDQPYPMATLGSGTESGTNGFPSYAIPNYVPPVKPQVVAGISTIELEEDPGEGEAIIAALVDNSLYDNGFIASEEWVPIQDITYYQAVSNGTNLSWTIKAVPDNLQPGDYAGLFILESDLNPNAQGYKVQISDSQYVYTDDQQILFISDGDTATLVKNYYIDESTPALMFHGKSEVREGDPDPGYRYALYLLSLGIPVYYEQMNSDFELVDINDPDYLKKNPRAEEWFVYINGSYVRTDDTSVQSGTDYYFGADISVESMYRGLEKRFFLDDENVPDYSFDTPGDYAVKYITSGGYPTFEYGPLAEPEAGGRAYGTSPLAEAMIRLAEAREDAVALIDHTNNPFRTIYETDELSVIKRVRSDFALDPIIGSYGAMFTPWYECTHTAITGGSENNFSNQMPASLAFLSALAQQLQNYNPWLAVSGVSRGIVPYCGKLHTNYTLTNNVADSYQVIPGDVGERRDEALISINPITYIRNYGYCIWGNRTLRNNSEGTQATSFLNIRNLVSDIKKTLYDASLSLMFEQNTDILWINFKSLITPLLDTMVTNYILDDYSLTRYRIDPVGGAPVPAYKVLASIRIVPINSVEVFELRVSLENSEVTIAETE